MSNYANRKLGKKLPSNGPTINFEDHLIQIPATPLVDNSPNLNYPMDMNDAWGDCVVAGWDHFLQVVNTLLMGSYVNLTTEEILTLYRTQNPDFDPTSPIHGPGTTADGGMDVQKFLNYLRKQGKIIGFARVDYTNPASVRSAIYLGLGIITGEMLTVAQQTQDVWDYVPSDTQWGGHCTVWVGYDKNDTCVTWGELKQMTPTFTEKQVDEAWFVITQAHINHPNFRKNFNLKSFAAEYEKLTGHKFPGKRTTWWRKLLRALGL